LRCHLDDTDAAAGGRRHPAATARWPIDLAPGTEHLINSDPAIRNRSMTRLWRRKSSGNFWWLMMDGNRPSPGKLEFGMASLRFSMVARLAFE
jgi:hypothetical protein